MKLVYICILIWIVLGCYCQGCGVPTVRYKNNFAREIRIGEFPWQVHLQLKWKYLCGGDILSRWWVVTTAHCIFMYSEALFESLVIVTGTLKLEGLRIIYGVHKVILHEYFIFELFGFKIPDNDIALVMVKEPIVFNKLVSPICFPDDRYLDMSTLENCWVTGWQMLSLAGSPISPIYQTVKQTVSHEKLEVCEKFYPENLRESVICVTNLDKQQSLCMGGYGAPLECQDKRTKMWVVAGAASHCPPSCNHTALFTSYIHYVDWVERVTISAGRPFIPYGLPPKPTLPCHQIQHPKPTLPSHKLQHPVELNPRQKPKRNREARSQWRGRHHKVTFESNSSNAERKPWQVLSTAVCLVQLALLT